MRHDVHTPLRLLAALAPAPPPLRLVAALVAALALALAADVAQAAPDKAPAHAAAKQDSGPMEYSQLLRAIGARTIRSAEVDDARSSMRVTLSSGEEREVSFPIGADKLIDRLAASGARVTLVR